MDSVKTILNTNLEKLFFSEVEELRKVKGDHFAHRLIMGLSRLNCLNSHGIVQIFKKEDSRLVLELLLAVIGYDPTAKEFVRPIDEREFRLLNGLRMRVERGEDKKEMDRYERLFYILIYDRDIAFESVEIIESTRGGLFLPDFLLISNAKEITGLNINALISGHSINYNFLQSLEGLNQKDRRSLDGLTFLMAAGSLQIVFCVIYLRNTVRLAKLLSVY